MHRKIERRLKFAASLLVFSGYLGLITTVSYGPDILLIPFISIALMPLGEWLDGRFRMYRRITGVGIFLFVGVFVLMLRRSAPLDAVLALVMFIQVYSLVHRKAVRNYGHLFLMSFFLLLSATAMTPRPDIAAVFLLFLVSLTWAMSLLEMFAASGGEARAGGIVPQWRSASGEIVLARAIGVFDTRFAVLITFTAVGVTAIAAAVFVGGPRTEAGVFGAARMGGEVAPTGLSTEVEFTLGGVIADSVAPVMRVQFPQEEGGQYSGPMLWRVTAMDAYTGGGWQHRGMVTRGYEADEARRLRTDSRLATREGIDRPSPGWFGGEWKEVYYEIYLDRPPQMGIPLLHLVKQVKPGPENMEVRFRWDVGNDFSVVATRRGENGIALTAISETMQPAAAQMEGLAADFSAMAAQDLGQLTYQDLLPETRALVQRLTRDARTPYQKVRALERYLMGNDFEYSRVVPVLPRENAIDAFLSRERQGHCQLFASALALMVRSEGLPARVVSGYRGGTWDPSDHSYTITEDMAHLWVEVYFGGVGWIPFDPSPIDHESDTFSLNALSRLYSRYVLKARLLWLRNVVAFEQRRRVESLREFSARLFRSGGETWDKVQSPERRVEFGRIAQRLLSALALLSAGGAVAWFVLRGRPAGRPRRVVLTADQRRASRLYRHLQRRMRRLGVSCAGRTAEEIALAAETVALNDGELLRAALALYNAARFGRRALGAGELGAWKRRIARLRVAPRAGGRVMAG